MRQSEKNKLLNSLKIYLQKEINISEEDFEISSHLFNPQKIKKNNFLFVHGDLKRYGILVINGILRIYSTDKSGEEYIVQFAMEGWWIGDLSSMINCNPELYSIDAIEDSDVVIIDKGSFDKLMSISSKFEKLFKDGMQKSHEVLQDRLTKFTMMSAEEKYIYMIKKYPDIILRVPQRHIASFLGIKPESLSRIRKKLSGKESYKTEIS